MSENIDFSILVVNDSHGIGKMVTEQIDVWAEEREVVCQVVVANDAAEAFKLLFSKVFDWVIVTGIRLVSFNGEELIRQIKKMLPEMRTILITGDFHYQPPDDLMLDGLLKKPFLLEELKNLLDESFFEEEEA